jgi:hypothetical protein
LGVSSGVGAVSVQARVGGGGSGDVYRTRFIVIIFFESTGDSAVAVVVAIHIWSEEVVAIGWRRRRWRRACRIDRR